MGIELPAELQDVAARAGARWPAADEDRMRESAAAWREAARSLDSLTRSADATAQGALHSFDGAWVTVGLCIGVAQFVLLAARWWFVARRLGLLVPRHPAQAEAGLRARYHPDR